jgi:hypothetical protein
LYIAPGNKCDDTHTSKAAETHGRYPLSRTPGTRRGVANMDVFPCEYADAKVIL